MDDFDTDCDADKEKLVEVDRDGEVEIDVVSEYDTVDDRDTLSVCVSVISHVSD